MSARSAGRRRAGRILALAAVGAIAGCATITYEAPLVESMVAMNRAAPTASYERLGDFESDRRAVFVVAQLLTVTDAELEDAIRRELARTGGDAVINLRIHEEYDFIDVLVGIVAGGIVNTRAITLRGDVVRWTGEAGEAGQAGQAGERGLEERLGLSERCRPLDVPVAGGATRTGYACVQ